MADTYTLAEAAKARLDASRPADVTIHDGEPLKTPASRYVVLTDNAGTATPDRLAHAGGSRDMRWLLTCKAIANSPAAARRLAGWLRATLTDAWLTAGPSTSQLHEIAASDILPGGPEGDRRHTQTLIWATYTDPHQET